MLPLGRGDIPEGQPKVQETSVTDEIQVRKPDITLGLRGVIDDLVADGRLAKEDADRLTIMSRLPEQVNWHPIEIIAEELYSDQKNPKAVLDIETLTQWLCEKSGQNYYRIDPLKIDAQAVTKVMSPAFAKRHGILALEVKDDEIVIASAQPFVYSWESTIEQSQTGKTITRVIANPAEIRRYTLEFFTIARSVAKADASGLATAGLSNLEAMLELGQMQSPDANDSHIVNVVDWLLQYAFDQRASDIHLEPRREKGGIRFRIDGVLHTVYELPPQVMTAVIARIKTLGRMDVADLFESQG